MPPQRPGSDLSLHPRDDSGAREEDGTCIDPDVAALRRYAHALLGAAAEANNVVQECLARALARAQPWRPVTNLRVHLFTVLHEVLAGRPGRRQAGSGTVVPLAAGASAAPSVPPTAPHGRPELRALAAALARLPEEQRQVVLLVGLEGLSYPEVAAVLHIPPSAVMARLSRGREALRRQMAGQTPAKLRMVR